MITWDVIALWLVGFVSGQSLSGGYLGTYFDFGAKPFLWRMSVPGIMLQVAGIIGGLVLLYLHQRGQSEKQRYRFVMVFSLGLISLAALFIFSGRAIQGLPFGTYDGAIQSEDAASMLIRGQNPYDSSFQNTPFAGFHMPHFDDVINPVLEYYPYPPMNALLNVPFAILHRLTGWPMESRWLLIGVFILISFAIIRRCANYREKTLVAIVLLANPLMFAYPLIGTNDILFAAALIATAFLAEQRRWNLAGVALGLALTLKQTAWLALPLWLVWLFIKAKRGPTERAALKRSLLWTAAVTGSVYLPFILWNPVALFNDLVRFVSGAVPHVLPIAGVSLWQFLLISKEIDTPWITNSAAIPQLIVLAIALPMVIKWLRRRPSAAQWLMASSVLIMCVSLVNRYFLDNYFSVLVMMGIAGIVLQRRQTESSQDSPPPPVATQSGKE
jgi:hypothetical protein